MTENIPATPGESLTLLQEIADAVERDARFPQQPDNGKIMVEIATGTIACLAQIGREVSNAQATDAAWAVVHRHGSEQVTAFSFAEMVQETRDLLDQARDEG